MVWRPRCNKEAQAITASASLYVAVPHVSMPHAPHATCPRPVRSRVHLPRDGALGLRPGYQSAGTAWVMEGGQAGRPGKPPAQDVMCHIRFGSGTTGLYGSRWHKQSAPPPGAEGGGPQRQRPRSTSLAQIPTIISKAKTVYGQRYGHSLVQVFGSCPPAPRVAQYTSCLHLPVASGW